MPPNSNSTAVPQPQPPTPPIEPSKRFLDDTAIASTICPDGERWVFVQNADGIVRGASTSSSTWTFTTNTTIETYVKTNSPLDAACIEYPSFAHGVAETAGSGPIPYGASHLTPGQFVGPYTSSSPCSIEFNILSDCSNISQR